MLGPRTYRLATVAAVTVAGALGGLSSIPAAGALAAGGVTPAHGSTRSALVHAFTTQDGTSQGIVGVYVSRSSGVVCQRTPDAGLVRFLFGHAGSSWRYAFSTRGTARGTATQRALERACR
ncbi:MAG TPA: hypothetical protein VG388_15565 [Solirubrobacteraceae bacterium]|jgi:hypothetical protein|nr:hypothetical protein [Solirubrobacteraceae bacterium]